MSLLLALGVGAAAGYLSRQPEINRLKLQVRILQQENQRLRGALEEQARQIQELKIRYNTLKAWQFGERINRMADIKARIIHQYCLKEYMDMALTRIRGNDLNPEMTTFFGIYSLFLNGKANTVSQGEFTALREFNMSKYGSEINRCIPPNMEETYKKLEKCDAA